MEIPEINRIRDQKHIAILDTSSISFVQGLHNKGIEVESIFNDYDLILIPKWVLIELNDAITRIKYLKDLINHGYPIYCIDEQEYTDFVNKEEGNLYQIVLASSYQLGTIRSYLRRNVEKSDSLDMDAYKDWIKKLYDEWPIKGDQLSNGRIRKKNAGEISITILSEIISWYYPNARTLTICSQDSDTYYFQNKAQDELRKIFISKSPVPISYKSNDVVLYQLIREGKIDIKNIDKYRKDMRNITYSKQLEDCSNALVKELVDNKSFVQLALDKNVHIIF